MTIKTGLFALAFISCRASAGAVEAEKNEINITVYNQNTALVRDQRSVQLKGGVETLRFSDIASSIEPASVRFKTLDAGNPVTVLEQNYEYDLVNSDRLLAKYVDKTLRALTKDDNAYEGALSSFDGAQLVLLKADGQVVMVNRENIRNIEFPRLPEGLITKPTLSWLLQSRRAASHEVEISYLSSSMGWQADYVAAVSEDEKSVGLNGWVTINNNSGASFENAGLKLIAGDVHQAEPDGEMEPQTTMYAAKGLAFGAPEPQFKEKSFFDYHMYTLGGRTTLKNGQSKQIALLEAPRVQAKKLYTYSGALYRWYYHNNWKNQTCNTKINVRLEIKNSKDNGLGVPLPKGKVRVYKADSDKSLEFIGSDAIDHTPKDEKLSLYLGDAFDITGERKITAHTAVSANIYRDTYEITLRNHKKESVKIKIIEKQWGDWQVLEKSAPFIKEDASTLAFEQEVPAGGSAVISYTAEYRF